MIPCFRYRGRSCPRECDWPFVVRCVLRRQFDERVEALMTTPDREPTGEDLDVDE